MDRHAYDRIAGDDYLAGLSSQSMSDLRVMRGECQELELTVSYLRRVVQGRLDIVRHEYDHRKAGLGNSDLSEIINSLPETLSVGAPGPGGLTHVSISLDALPTPSAEVNHLLDNSGADRIPELNDKELDGVLDSLQELEAEVSEMRRLLFDRLDQLSGEITRRYRSGEATVDELLR
ncbi:MAG: AmfC protein [Acidimicrobiia bacterium]|nr:AmfC protein [Acidimicrobiia bacterium]